MKFYSTILLFFVTLHTLVAQIKPASPVTDNATMDKVVNELMAKMTTEEKIGQLNLPSIGFDVTGPIVSKDVESKIKKGLVGAVFNTFTPQAVRKLQDMAVKESRLGIPLIFGMDVIHGHRTTFPIPLAMSCTWDMGLIEKSARIAATEASADGLNWTFSPMVDISRDPRWGRVAEGGGEDPLLGSRIAQAMVRGYQGTDLSADNTIMACVKHFALYGAAEAGRDYNTVDMSLQKMYEFYLPPYKAAIQAGAGSVMSSFNDINGTPASASKWLMTDVLRKQWGFKGFVVTDYKSINEMINHGVGDKLKDVTALALIAGIDMDMVGEGFLLHAKELVLEGKVSQASIDEACRLILEAKYKLGLFDDPYRYISEERAKTSMITPANREAAREISRQSMVLLKNNNQILPLKKSGTIALIGPMASNKHDILGTWGAAGDDSKSVSAMEGIKSAVGDAAKVIYAKGCNFITDRELLQLLTIKEQLDPRSDDDMIREALETATKADVVVAILGEPLGMSGEAACRSELGLPGRQQDLLKALLKTGKPIVLVVMSGRPLILEWEDRNIPAILEAWHAGTETGNALADVLFGDYNPSGKLSMTFPRNVGQIPIYYAIKNTGRPSPMTPDDKYYSHYIDVPNTPLYPFGYGLSYTTFVYGDLKLDKTIMTNTSVLTASVTLTNSGKYDGTEIAQLYIRDMVGSITRPLKELVDFQKVLLKAGESKTISFKITADQLAFYNEKLQLRPEPGDFKVFVGGNSVDVKEAGFRLE